MKPWLCNPQKRGSHTFEVTRTHFCDICCDMHACSENVVNEVVNPSGAEHARSPVDKQHKWLPSDDDEADHQNRVALVVFGVGSLLNITYSSSFRLWPLLLFCGN
jgi:hypothetical protein